MILDELRLFDEKVAAKPQIVAANKIDALDDPSRLTRLEQRVRTLDLPFHQISGVTGEGIDDLLEAAWRQIAAWREAPAETALTSGETAELGELELSMRDTREWFQPRNAAARYRYLALLEKQEGEQQTTRPPTDIAVRQQEIQAMMADQHSPYWKGPRAAGLQAEYAMLLEGKETAHVSAEVATSWAEHLGLSEDEVHAAHGRALEIEQVLPDSIADIEASIGGLSEGTQDLIRHILADPSNPAIPYDDASAAELREWFAAMPRDEQQAIRDVLGVAF